MKLLSAQDLTYHKGLPMTVLYEVFRTVRLHLLSFSDKGIER